MRNDLARAILNCGADDLSLLDDAGADMFETVQRMRDEGLEISLNGIIEEVFKEGIFRMREKLKEEKEWLESLERSEDITEYGYEKLQAIRKHNLDPQTDFSYYINFLDTHLNVDSGKRKVYDEYFEKEMEDLSEYTGFDIEG